MAFDIASISSALQVRAPRIVLLGTHGIGKSKFASGADNPVFLPVKGEEGIDSLDVMAFPVIHNHNECLEAVGTLYTAEHDYKTLVMDSSSTFAPLVDEWAIQTEGVKDKANLGGGFGRQYDTILSLWREVLDGFDALRNDRGMTIIIIGHVTVRQSRDPESEHFDQWSFDIDRKVGDMLIRWSDCTLFMNRKTMVKKTDAGFSKKQKQGIDISGGQRWLFTQETPTHPGKIRDCFGDLPAEIPLPKENAWGAFMAEVEKAMAARQAAS